MRNKKDITRLENLHCQVSFPDGNEGFDRFTERLREIILANCGYDISKTLRFDEFEYKYYVDVAYKGRPDMFLGVVIGDKDDVCITVSKYITIDQSKPLGPQIQAIIDADAHVRKRFHRLCIAMDKDNIVDCTCSSCNPEPYLPL